MSVDVEVLKTERDAVQSRLSALRWAKMSDVAIIEAETEKLRRLDVTIDKLSDK